MFKVQGTNLPIPQSTESQNFYNMKQSVVGNEDAINNLCFRFTVLPHSSDPSDSVC